MWNAPLCVHEYSKRYNTRMSAARLIRTSLIVILLSCGLFVTARVRAASPSFIVQQVFPVPTLIPTDVVRSTQEQPSTPAPTPAPDAMTKFVLASPRPELTVISFMRYLIRVAVERGVSANMIVFLLLFPVIASLVAFSRHVIGLTGFSIYAPVALAVVLLSTGIIQGLVLFFLMLVIAVIGKWTITFLKLEYVPRTAMLLWFVAIGMFFALLLSTLLPITFFFRIDMFPLLILVLLAEDFMGMQAGLRWQLAIERALQIMFLSVLGALIMGSTMVQQLMLSEPEIVVLCVGIFNFLVGKYLGLRLTEYLRFKPIIDAEE